MSAEINGIQPVCTDHPQYAPNLDHQKPNSVFGGLADLGPTVG